MVRFLLFLLAMFQEIQLLFFIKRTTISNTVIFNSNLTEQDPSSFLSSEPMRSQTSMYGTLLEKPLN